MGILRTYNKGRDHEVVKIVASGGLSSNVWWISCSEVGKGPHIQEYFAISSQPLTRLQASEARENLNTRRQNVRRQELASKMMTELEPRQWNIQTEVSGCEIQTLSRVWDAILALLQITKTAIHF